MGWFQILIFLLVVDLLLCVKGICFFTFFFLF